MKKIKFIIALVLLLGLGTFTFFKVKSPLPPSNMVVSSAKLISQYNTANAMVNSSPVIVIGVKGSEKVDFSYDDAGMIDRYGTVSEFKVKKVIKNETGNTIKDKETISVLENAAYDKKTNKLYSVEGYQLMNENKRYILFLQPNKSTWGPYVDSYEIKGVVYGKFAFGKDKKERNNQDSIESSAYAGDMKKDHDKLYEEVAKMYDKINDESAE